MLPLELCDSALQKFDSANLNLTATEKLPEDKILIAAADGLFVDPVFKDFHCVQEGAISHRDHHINGIEVCHAVEAPCQVRFEISGRVEMVANRASEPECFTVVSYLKV